MESKVSEKDMREVYFQAFGKEYDSADRKQAPLPLDIAYLVALNKLKREGKYEGGGEITDDTYYQSVNDFVFFCMNYPANFLFAFGSLKNHLANKFKTYYNSYGSFGVMIKFYTELDSKNRRILTDFAYENYDGTYINSDISEVEYFNSVNHFIFFCFNFPNNFMEAFPSNLRVHLSEKWSYAYNKKGSVGAMIYFWSELSDDNRKRLANWSKENYTGTRLYEAGGLLGEVAGMLPSPLPMSTIQPMAKGGMLENAQTSFSIHNDYYGNLELGFYNIEFKNEKGTSISNKSFYKLDDAFETLFEYLKSENGQYIIKKEPKSNFYIEESSYDGKSTDSDGYPDTKYKTIFKISSKKINELTKSNNFEKGGQLELFADGGIADGVEIDFNNLENINKGDIIVKKNNYNFLFLLKVLKVRDRELVFQNLNSKTILPNSFSIGDLDGSTSFRTLTEKEKFNVFGDAEKLDFDKMVEKLYTIYSKSSNFDNEAPESVLYTYIRKFDLPIIKRYQILKNNEVVYDTLEDDFMKTPYGKKNYNYSNGGGVEPNIYFYNDGEQDITFTTFEQAYNEVQRLGYSKFRDNLGGEYFVNKDLTKKTIDYNYADGGGVDDCIEYIKNSESIKDNGYYLHIDNMYNYVGSNSLNIPKINSLCLITFNSGGQKNLKAVDTINSMLLSSEIAKLLNIDIEIARIIVSEQITFSKPFTMNMLDDIENKNIIIADRDTIVCTNLSMQSNDSEYKSAFNSKQEFLKGKTELERIEDLKKEVSKNKWSREALTEESGIVKVYSPMYDLDKETVASIFNEYQKKYADGGDMDDISLAKSNAIDTIDFEYYAKEYAGDSWDKMSDSEKAELIRDIRDNWFNDYEYEKGGEIHDFSKDEILIINQVLRNYLSDAESNLNYYSNGASRYFHEEVRGNLPAYIESAKQKVSEINDDIKYFNEHKELPYGYLDTEHESKLFLTKLNELPKTNNGREIFKNEIYGDKYYEVYEKLYDRLDSYIDDKFDIKYSDGGETEFPIYTYGKIDGKPFEVIGVNYKTGIVRVKNFSEYGIKEMTISEWIPLTYELGTPASFIENGREVSGEVVMRDGKRAISLYKDDNYGGDSERIRFFNQIDLTTLKSFMDRETFSLGGFLLGAGAGALGYKLYLESKTKKGKEKFKRTYNKIKKKVGL